jgi:TubC N-terminal docking domain
VAGDRLVYRAPKGAMTPELLWDLEAHKAEVITILHRRRCTTCGSIGRCEGRVPLPGGGWFCQAAINAGILPDPADEPAEDLRRHER